MDLSLDFLSGSSESIFLFFVPVPYCFDNCSFVVCFEVSLSFLKIALGKKKIAWLFRVFKTERKKMYAVVAKIYGKNEFLICETVKKEKDIHVSFAIVTSQTANLWPQSMVSA